MKLNCNIAIKKNGQIKSNFILRKRKQDCRETGRSIKCLKTFGKHFFKIAIYEKKSQI